MTTPSSDEFRSADLIRVIVSDTQLPRRIWISGIDRLLADRAHAEADQASDAGHAVTAIILAVAAFHAHIGEWLAYPTNGAMFTATELDSLRWGPAYGAARVILMKRDVSCDPSAQRWFHRLKGIHELRNHVAHYTPEKRDTGTFPERLRPYIEGGTFTPDGDDSMDWTSRLIVERVAREAVAIGDEAKTEFERALDGWPG